MDTTTNAIAAGSEADERIVAALTAKGRLKDADLARARRLQEEAGGSLLSLLARLGLVSERDHAATWPRCWTCRWSAPRTRRNCRRKA